MRAGSFSILSFQRAHIIPLLGLSFKGGPILFFFRKESLEFVRCLDLGVFDDILDKSAHFSTFIALFEESNDLFLGRNGTNFVSLDEDVAGLDLLGFGGFVILGLDRRDFLSDEDEVIAELGLHWLRDLSDGQRERDLVEFWDHRAVSEGAEVTAFGRRRTTGLFLGEISEQRRFA